MYVYPPSTLFPLAPRLVIPACSLAGYHRCGRRLRDTGSSYFLGPGWGCGCGKKSRCTDGFMVTLSGAKGDTDEGSRAVTKFRRNCLGQGNSHLARESFRSLTLPLSLVNNFPHNFHQDRNEAIYIVLHSPCPVLAVEYR
jgi:hypothetical protein